MPENRLHCVLFPDLHPWERHVFESLIRALATRMPTELHESKELGTATRAVRDGGGRVWVIANRWREAARRVSRQLPSSTPLYVSALDTRQEPVTLPGLFWGAFMPKATNRYRVFAHSAFAYRTLREMEGMPAERLELMPLPVASSFANRAPDFPPRATTVGVLGAFNSDNNLHFVLNVAHYVGQHRRDARIRLVGEGALATHLRAAIKELELGDIVEVLEAKGNWSGLDLDLLLYAPLRAAHHIPLLMAASAGIPALCSEVYGIEELIEDGKDGFVLPVNETKPTAELILQMLSNPPLRQFFGGKLRAKLNLQFSLDSVAAHYAAHFISGSASPVRVAA